MVASILTKIKDCRINRLLDRYEHQFFYQEPSDVNNTVVAQQILMYDEQAVKIVLQRLYTTRNFALVCLLEKLTCHKCQVNAEHVNGVAFINRSWIVDEWIRWGREYGYLKQEKHRFVFDKMSL